MGNYRVSVKDYPIVEIHMTQDRLKVLQKSGRVNIYLKGIHYIVGQKVEKVVKLPKVVAGGSVEQEVMKVLAKLLGNGQVSSITSNGHQVHHEVKSKRSMIAKTKECPECHVMFLNTMCLGTHRKHKHGVAIA